ncbi:Minor histocompatibility antigen H13 [Nymphon striatum]|nr:Minor histocompatibility antigen H13 [Nymphon striatum]
MGQQHNADVKVVGEILRGQELMESGEKPETMTKKDAAMFPLIASAALFGLYIFFRVFSKEHINLLLTGYFFFLGVLALAHIISPIVKRAIPASFPNEVYHLLFHQGEGDAQEELINYKFDRKDLICIFMCSIVGVWYLWKKHWIANNLFGLAFAINGVELLHLNSVVTGCILLGGLFFYDIFWVSIFISDNCVAFQQIGMIFPQDILENGLGATNFAMLGLGDIVIPGIFIALLLRFDQTTKRKCNLYFCTSFTAYILGLLLTIFIMHFYKHAQPALLYLVPACIGLPLLMALIMGDIKELFSYEDHPAEELELENSELEPITAEESKKDE